MISNLIIIKIIDSLFFNKSIVKIYFHFEDGTVEYYNCAEGTMGDANNIKRSVKKKLSISPETIYQHCKLGKIPFPNVREIEFVFSDRSIECYKHV